MYIHWLPHVWFLEGLIFAMNFVNGMVLFLKDEYSHTSKDLEAYLREKTLQICYRKIVQECS